MLRGTALAVLLALGMSTTGSAETFVWIQNRTSFPIDVSARTEDLSRSYWSPMATMVRPGQKVKVLRFNRDSGITKGRWFTFTTTVSAQGRSFDLVQKVRGSLIGSHLWQSVEGVEFSDERHQRHATWILDAERAVPVTYRAVACGAGDDDVEYVFDDPPPAAKAEGPLKVLAYNVWMRPTSIFSNGQMERARLLGQRLKGLDVIVFCEVFDDDARDELLGGLRSRYPYQTNVIGQDHGLGQDGGVAIASCFPIERTAQYIYRAKDGSDGLAQKGVCYVAIRRGSERIHIFATHLQAQENDDAVAARTKQVRELRQFINEQYIPAHELVLVAGDLNIALDSAEWKNAEQILKVVPGTKVEGPQSNEPGNPLATAPFGQLDYVVPLADHLVPAKSTMKTVPVVDAKGWSELPGASFVPVQHHLSDHHALAATFELSPAVASGAAAPVDPAGSPGQPEGPVVSLLGVPSR